MKSIYIKYTILIILIFMIIDPSFKIPGKAINNQTLILIDRSNSIRESQAKIDEIVKRLGNIKKMYFSDKVYESIDDVKDRDQTNITNSLQQTGNKYSNIILISDGNDLSGSNIPNISAKVYSIPIGKDKEDFDIILSNIKKPINIRDSQEALFEFEVLLKGTKEINAIFSFEEEKRPVRLTKGINIIKHRLTSVKGSYLVKAGIIPVFGEKITKNNMRDLSFEVNDEKYSVLIMQDFVNVDSAFIKRSISSSCDVFIKLKGKDLFPDKIDSYDAIIEFDNSRFSPDKLIKYTDNGGLYLFFLTKNTNFHTLPPFIDKKKADIIYNIDPIIPQKYLKSKYFNLKENILSNMKIWKDFIDLEYLYDISSKQGEIIITTDNDIPVCEIIRKSKGSAIIFYGGPLYKMSLRENSETSKNLFDHFFRNLILSNINNDSLIRISDIKDYYKLDENINIRYSTEYTPGNIDVYLNQKKINSTGSINIKTDKIGKNELLFQLVNGKKTITSKRVLFNVYKDFSELEKTTINYKYLEKISSETSGKVFDIDQLDILKNELDSKRTVFKDVRPVHSLIFSLILFFLISLYFIFTFLE
ncbi:MAG: hypothetical protein C0601_03125 [Candidatus Muiribacterium halophilum]|uniref:VWFA domain-containing protein n=1 Tax=Muiribacterium halophilum TaxID=2053465 RepID=A0A2N5ZK36_MUIH1|nr:MAG: hypothetical protein C0601_03125 [Candidatus Muirbacterium halophilum]